MIADKLSAILTTTNDWLKFAETKLTVLVTINAAAGLAAAQLLSNDKFPEYVALAVIAYLVITSISIVLGLVGIMPRLKINPFVAHSSQSNSDNLLFYGHAAKYEPSDYTKAICRLSGVAETSYTAYDVALSGQIITNAKICLSKFRVFSWAIRTTMYGILVLLEIILLGMLTPLY